MKKQILARYCNPAIAILFIIGSFLFFNLNYKFQYAFLEQYSMFQNNSFYLAEKLSEPGGFNEYISSFLSLAFIYNGGAALVIALFLGLISCLFHAFLKKMDSSSGILAALVPCFIFWVFPQESVAVLVSTAFSLLATYIYTNISNYKYRIPAGLLLIIVLYFIATPAHILFSLLCLIYELSVKDNKKAAIAGFINLALALILPLVAMRSIYIIPMREAYLSKYLCHPEHEVPASIYFLLYSFPIISVLVLITRGKVFIKNENIKAIANYITVIAASVVIFTYMKNPMEQAYRYDYYARNGEWEKIVKHAERHSIKDMDALVYLNLALSHTGRLASDMFRFPQMGESGFITKDPKSRMGLIQASEVAWQVGQINASQRFAFVGVLSSQRCVQPRLMKRLVETYIVNGEYKAAEKYIKILESAPHYSKWAKEQRSLLNEKSSNESKWVAEKRALMPITDNPFDLTVSFPSAIAFLIDDHIDNRAAFDYGMGFLLMYGDMGAFIHYMNLIKGKYKSLPKHYQEALCLYYIGMKADKNALASYNVSQDIMNRFISFTQNVRTSSPAVLKSQFGDTYYYYYLKFSNSNSK